MTRPSGRPKKFSLTLREEYEALPNTPENQEQRRFLLKMIMEQQKLEKKPRQIRTKVSTQKPPFSFKQNPGAKAEIDKLLNRPKGE